MDPRLELLLYVYLGTVLLNVAIALIQARSRSWNSVELTTVCLWLGLLLTFGSGVLFPHLNLWTILGFSLSAIPFATIARLTSLTMGLRARWKVFAICYVAGVVATVVLWELGLGFTVSAIPVTVGLTWPVFELFFQGLRSGNWRRFSFNQKFYLLATLLLALHFLDYPFLRPMVGTSIFGFSFAYALAFLLSILVPMLVNEKAYLEYNAKLESEVTQKTQMLLFSSKMAALGEMAGGIAHEINNPLAILQSAAQVMEVLVDERREVDRKALRDVSARIVVTVDRVAKIIQGLRSFARDGSRDKMEPIALHAVLEEVLGLCRERFKLQEIRLEVEEPEPNLWVTGRSVQITQVLLNLLNNAYDAVAGASERWVKVAIALKQGRIEIAVTDSGKGIAPGLREKLFQPFFTTKDVGKGTGLGLSISKGIVEAHGGSLELDPKRPNTCFVMRLPALPAAS